MKKFAIIGFGGLGKVHYENVAAVTKQVDDIQLVALCDIDENAFYKQTETNISSSAAKYDFSRCNLYNDAKDLFDNEELDFVITAVPTPMHEPIAVMAMERGVHVFSEKPMARTAEQAERMIEAAKKNNVKLMIGQCVRYGAAPTVLKEMISSEKYGKVIKADFSRKSATPIWSWQSWYLDETQSGGAALDMHIHDVDLVNYLFGMPKAVSSVATNAKTKHDSIHTQYHYCDDKVVTALGDWGFPQGYPFTSAFTVKFEKATVTFMNREGMKLYPEDGEPSQVELPQVNGYVNEVVDFLKCIDADCASEINPPEESLRSLRIALAEKESADSGEKVVMNA